MGVGWWELRFCQVCTFMFQVIHELAEAFHCKSDSHDHEPKRNVVVTAEKNVCRQPTPLLSDAVMEKPVTSQRKVSPKPTRKG